MFYEIHSDIYVAGKCNIHLSLNDLLIVVFDVNHTLLLLCSLSVSLSLSLPLSLALSLPLSRSL